MTTAKSHKRRGKSFESDLEAHLRDKGYDAQRLPLTGSKDEGDIAVRIGGGAFVIEAKAPGAGNSIDLSGWLKEAETEAIHYAEARGLDPELVTPLLVIKARGKGLDQAYLVRRLGSVFR